VSDFYSDDHRRFQETHGTRALADRLEVMAHSEFATQDRDADSLSAEDQQRVTDAGGAIPLEDYRGEDATAAETPRETPTCSCADLLERHYSE
jgi:hypothetical protein